MSPDPDSSPDEPISFISSLEASVAAGDHEPYFAWVDLDAEGVWAIVAHMDRARELEAEMAGFDHYQIRYPKATAVSIGALDDYEALEAMGLDNGFLSAPTSEVSSIRERSTPLRQGHRLRLVVTPRDVEWRSVMGDLLLEGEPWSVGGLLAPFILHHGAAAHPEMVLRLAREEEEVLLRMLESGEVTSLPKEAARVLLRSSDARFREAAFSHLGEVASEASDGASQSPEERRRSHRP